MSREEHLSSVHKQLVADAVLAERERILALLKEPSAEMLESGGELLLDGRIEIEAAKANARGVWRAMLGVAKLGTGG